MSEAMKKIPTPAEYLNFVESNDISGAEAYLIEHFGVVGQESFKEKEYEAFAEATMQLVGEKTRALAEKAEENETKTAEEVAEEGVANESKVSEADVIGKASD